jgi:hypothetical protein
MTASDRLSAGRSIPAARRGDKLPGGEVILKYSPDPPDGNAPAV